MMRGLATSFGWKSALGVGSWIDLTVHRCAGVCEECIASGVDTASSCSSGILISSLIGRRMSEGTGVQYPADRTSMIFSFGDGLASRRPLKASNRVDFRTLFPRNRRVVTVRDYLICSTGQKPIKASLVAQ